jgi:hypothetical protein
MKILGLLLMILGAGCFFITGRIMTTGGQSDQDFNGVIIFALLGLILFIPGILQFKKKK